MTDEQREQRIQFCRRLLANARDAVERRKAREQLEELVRNRSPEQIARMEAERGLCG